MAAGEPPSDASEASAASDKPTYGIPPEEIPVDADAQAKLDLAGIPKIPYSRGLRLSGREVMRIAMLMCTLVLLLVMQKPCAQAVSSFVTNMDLGSAAGSAGSAAVAPVGVHGVHLRAGQTDAEMKQQLDSLRGSAAATAPATPTTP